MSRTSGPIDLAVELDRTGIDPLRDQLGAQLRAAILAGRLAPGTVLPATRPLAAHLGSRAGSSSMPTPTCASRAWSSCGRARCRASAS